jgi:hypothetical protein
VSPFAIHRAKDNDGTYFVCMKLWNIGSGPAIVQNVRMSRDTDYLGDLPHFQPVGAGHAADIEIPCRAWPRSSRAATLQIEYRRANGIAYVAASAVTIDGQLVLCRTYARRRRDAPRG